MKQTIADVVSASLTYYGETDLGHATSDYSWSIKRTSVSGGVTTVSYPIGERGFPSASEAFRWIDRANLSYSLTPDTTAPELSTVTIASDNSDTELAKVGDTVTLTIASSEAIQAPTVRIGVGSATVAQGGTILAWTASRVLTSEDVEGAITFSIAFKDIGGMSGAAVTATTDASAVTFDKTVPTMLSAERIANTTIRVKLSEVCDTATMTKSNAGGFVVKDTAVPATTFAVSAIAPNGGNHDEIDLTVATIVGSASTGVTVTYVKGGNGTVADDAGNLLQTNATGVLVAAWA